MVKLAINGFGRIGRLVVRAVLESPRFAGETVEIVAINDRSGPDINLHLLRYDSLHGRLGIPLESRAVSHGNEVRLGDGEWIPFTSLSEPESLPWRDLGVDVALECTGAFTTRETAGRHLANGSSRVLVSAPTKGSDRTVVYGVNHHELTSDDTLVSNASCTTNCLAPMVMVLDQAVGIDKGHMTSVHAYTADQRLIDASHKDYHRARSAALSMIPTSTGAARAIGLILPHLDGRLDGTAIRVPTPNVSMVDLTFVAKRATSVEEINSAMLRAADGPMRGIIGNFPEPLVSIDFVHCPVSTAFAPAQTNVIDGTLVRVMAWYDNEWAFSHRMIDTAVAMATH